MTRQAPSISATECKVGTKKKGDDGKFWIVVETKNEVKRWQKFSAETAEKSERAQTYKAFAAGKKPLKVAYINTLKRGEKLKLAVFRLKEKKADFFTFTFDRIEPVKGSFKKYYTYDIYGKSSYRPVKYSYGDSMIVYKGGDIRVGLNPNFSPVYLA